MLGLRLNHISERGPCWILYLLNVSFRCGNYWIVHFWSYPDGNFSTLRRCIMHVCRSWGWFIRKRIHYCSGFLLLEWQVDWSFAREYISLSSIHGRLGLTHVLLTHWGRDEMAAVSQTILSNAFSWMKMLEFRLRFHWSLFLRVQLTIIHHWFR